jgi:hypothetical protein
MRMALWVLQTDAEQDLVTLTYFEKKGAPAQECGHGAIALLRDVEAWCMDQAAPWDRVQTDRGVFMRQVSAFVQA